MDSAGRLEKFAKRYAGKVKPNPSTKAQGSVLSKVEGPKVKAEDAPAAAPKEEKA